MLTTVLPASTGVRPPTAPDAGRAELVAVRGRGGSTVVTRAYASSPLRLLLPKNHGHGAWVYLSSFGGGLVDGDRLTMTADVQRGASLFVSTQASTKVYRCQRGAESHLEARVADDALLVLAPDPVVCFAQARYRQHQDVAMDPRAGLVLVDWVTSGRHASGERWAFDDYVARLTVRRGGRLQVFDTVALRRAHGDLPHRLGRFDVMGVALVLGAPLREMVAGIRRALSDQPVLARAEDVMAVAPVGEDGCLVRFAGTSSERAAARLRGLLGDVPRLLGDDPWARKW